MDDETERPDVAAGGGAGGLMVLDNTKAGMAAVDRAAVERVINEASMGTPFYENEQRKAAQRVAKIEKMIAASREFDKLRDHSPFINRAAAAESAAEARRNVGLYAHLDMDMFYAAVEEILDPTLKDVPFGVGGESMLSTSNYLARQFGVRAGMPGYLARKLCPQLRIVWGQSENYRRYAEIVRGVCKEYDPNYVSPGWDELTMDLMPAVAAREAEREPSTPSNDTAAPTNSGAQQHTEGDANSGMVDEAAEEPRSTAWVIVSEIRAKIEAATGGLTASVGIAATPLLAKVCSNYNKPNGVFELPAKTAAEVKAYVFGLTARTIPGIGKVQEQLLAALGVVTCRDMYDARARLAFILPGKSFENLLEASIGVAGCTMHQHDDSTRQSLGAERTFRQMTTAAELIALARKLFDRIHTELVDKGLVARQVGLKLKRRTFEVTTETATIGNGSFTIDAAAMWAAFDGLLQPHMPHFAEFRLLGLRFCSLCKAGEEEQQGKATSPKKSKAKAEDLGKGQPRVDELFAAALRRSKRTRDDELTPTVLVKQEGDASASLLQAGATEGGMTMDDAAPLVGTQRPFSLESDSDSDGVELVEDRPVVVSESPLPKARPSVEAFFGAARRRAAPAKPSRAECVVVDNDSDSDDDVCVVD